VVVLVVVPLAFPLVVALMLILVLQLSRISNLRILKIRVVKTQRNSNPRGLNKQHSISNIWYLRFEEGRSRGAKRNRKVILGMMDCDEMEFLGSLWFVMRFL
jgi:hypothetical protein